MVYNRLYINVFIRVILLTINAVGLGFAFVYLSGDDFFTICIIALILIVQTILFIYSYNRINRDLQAFFVSVKSEDLTLGFKDDGKNNPLNQLHLNFNRVNEMLKKLKLSYETQNQYFKIVTSHASAGLISFYEDGKIEIFNNAAQKLLNISHMGNIKSLRNIDENLPDFLFNLKPSEQKLIRVKIKSEIIALSMNATELIIENKRIKLISLQNIKNELVENEIEAWQKLFRVLTHEIMNSVGPISSTVSTMSDTLKNKEELIEEQSVKLSNKVYEKTTRGLDIIGERSEGLLDFVDNFRKFTLFPAPEISKLKVSDLFQNIHDLLEEKLKISNIKLIQEISDPSLILMVDKGLVEQVMINLINNSIAFLKETEKKMINLNAYSDEENRIVIQVIDNGAGVSEENIDQIFVPFFTTKEDGSGIGLSLSRQIMRKHGGTISVKSDPNIETVFTLKF
ncbi:PAS domain-containing sensor histidine kinase [Bacteroidota bacterium]